MFQYSLYLYNRLEPLGAVRLYGIITNKEPGMAITLGYPHDELEDLPRPLLEETVHVFGAQPRRVTCIKLKGSRYTAPAEDGGWVDKIRLYEGPEESNCLWTNPTSARAFGPYASGLTRATV
ncbi:hypothetical protein FRC11_008543 [Ceratobasidium sp. 423]|nr:hypothetical protein FRC11_008543 [Ceratobasidium sp. 423]